MWTDALQELIEAKVATGRLVLLEPIEDWGGFSAAARCCAGCDKPILTREMHHRMVGSDGSVLNFHPRCRSYFDSARLGRVEELAAA